MWGVRSTVIVDLVDIDVIVGSEGWVLVEDGRKPLFSLIDLCTVHLPILIPSHIHTSLAMLTTSSNAHPTEPGRGQSGESCDAARPSP